MWISGRPAAGRGIWPSHQKPRARSYKFSRTHRVGFFDNLIPVAITKSSILTSHPLPRGILHFWPLQAPSLLGHASRIPPNYGFRTVDGPETASCPALSPRLSFYPFWRYRVHRGGRHYLKFQVVPSHHPSDPLPIDFLTLLL